MKTIPLLLIHGYPLDHTMWFSTIASLGASAKVIAPDLPGFGRNPHPDQTTPSLEYYAEFLKMVLDEGEHEKAVVAGMSMGGYVGLAFAEMYPERTRGLGLVSSQTAADSPETRQSRKETIKKVRADGPDAATETLVAKMFAPDKTENPDLRKYLIEGARMAGVNGLCWALEAMAKRPDRTELLKAFTDPVLILHGTEDKIVPFAKMRELAESCRNPFLVELRGVGHASPLEAPDQVAAGLARLMTNCGVTRPAKTDTSHRKRSETA